MLERILVTEKEYAKAAQVFGGATHFSVQPVPDDEAALSAAVLRMGSRAVIIGVTRYSGPLYQALKQTGQGCGSILARFGVGHDGVDKTMARQNGVTVCNTPGVLDLSVAEHAFWLMGNLARRLSRSEARLRAGEFAGETGGELHGKRLGVLGFGRIGRRVAAMAHFGFGMSVRAADVMRMADLEAQEKRPAAEIQQAYGLDLYTNDNESLLRECDFLTIHLPAMPATHHFINAARLGLMKASAAVINTARGSLLDEAALFDALAGGRLAGAALDVFEHEPYRPVAPGKDLRQLPNVVMTPHIGSNTREANQRMAEACLANLTHFFAGTFDRLTQVPVA